MRKRIGSIIVLAVCLLGVYTAGSVQAPAGIDRIDNREKMAGEEMADGGEQGKDVDSIIGKEGTEKAGIQEEAVQEETVDEQGLQADSELPVWKTFVTIESGGEEEYAEYCDQVIRAEYIDDLSLLEALPKTDHHYAYLDGKVYYRQYHEDSFAEGGLWAIYQPVPDTEKEMVCIDHSGAVTTLFTDKGWGDFYLLGGRFYMTEGSQIYSVDMEGNDRVSYGSGEILAVDEERNIILLERKDEERGYDESGDVNDYLVIDGKSGACTSLDLDPDMVKEDGHRNRWGFEAYQDGWLYLSCFRWIDGPEDVDTREHRRDYTKETVLYAVSLEGEWNKVTTLVSHRTYTEYIHQLEAVGDRLFFIFGGYDGSAQVYQGGSIITVRRDGTDYCSVKNVDSGRYPSNSYYLQRDGERIRLYFPFTYYIGEGDEGEDYGVTVWEAGTKRLYPSDFPTQSIGAGYANSLYVDEKNRVFARPDQTGRIVRVTGPLEDYIEDWPGKVVNVRGKLEDFLDDWIESENGEPTILCFKQPYYRDGYLYFKAEYSQWSQEESIGWRDGYIRLLTEYYRLKPGEDRAELLYFY